MAIDNQKAPSKMGAMFKKEEVEEAEMMEEQAEAMEEQEEEGGGVYAFLAEIGGPSKEQVDEWKESFGGVHMLPLGDDMVFIYRGLKRAEWNALNSRFMNAGDSLTEDQKKEALVTKCILWPRIGAGGMNLMEAGLLDTLNEAVHIASYFMAPQTIMNLVMRL